MGYPPEAVMMDLIISGEFKDYLSRASERGLLQAMRLSSLTGQYGIFSRLHRFKRAQAGRLDGSFAARHPQRRLLGGVVARGRKRLSATDPACCARRSS